MWYAEAQHGNVSLSTQDDCVDCLMSRKEAADLIVKLASALQHAGDICDPDMVRLHEAAVAARKSLEG